jgi:hypothetical protein
MATTGELRAKLNTQLSDQELVAFCTDHFPMVYNQFTAGMTQGQRIQLLLDYAVRRGLLDDLERLIEEFLRKRDELPATGGSTAATVATAAPPSSSQAPLHPTTTPAAYAELEIGFHRRGDNGYEVALQFSHSDSDTDDRKTTQSQIDLAGLRDITDPVAYGKSLGQSLFRVTEIMTYYKLARSKAADLDVPLRLRLTIGKSAPELHTLWWETLWVPGERTALATSEWVLFSRYLETESPQKVKPLSHREDLRALLAVSNPTNLDEYKPGGYRLAPVDVEGEIARTKKALGEQVKPLASNGSATINNLTAELREGKQHILYLVAHGTQKDGYAHIWLEDEQGNAEVISTSSLVSRLSNLRHRPLLAVLASCQSASTTSSANKGSEGEKDSVLVALGPLLADIGIPAVLAMQGNISMDTVAKFMPQFFTELQRTGEIDLAVAVARGSVSDRPDWWMPVLFMSIRSGRLWGNPAATTGEITMDDEKIQHLKKELKRYEKISHELKMQKASFGLHTPPHITLGIEEAEEEIAKLKRQLDTSS